MAKTKLTKSTPDAILIRECVSYAQAVAAFNGGFHADPDGSSKTAQRLGRCYQVGADEALEKIIKIRAVSDLGLDGKRRVAQIIMDEGVHGRYGHLEKNEMRFLISFLSDLKEYFQDRDVKDNLEKIAKAA